MSCNLDSDARILDLLMETREQNKCLKLQVDTLKQKLKDAEGDIKVLRASSLQKKSHKPPAEVALAPTLHQREEMIEQLEKLNIKNAQLKVDLKIILDEKHELETERDAFKCKAHRLNHELSKALNASKPLDVDSLINENRFLQERLEQLTEEKELIRQSVTKYKSMLGGKKIKGAIKLGGNSTVGSVMTHKQVEQLLQQGTPVPQHQAAGAIADLRCLCNALLESVNDKTLALAHQKKANKILALRLCELDTAVQSPTMKLLEGYTGANVDLKCDEELAELQSRVSDDNTDDLEDVEVDTLDTEDLEFTEMVQSSKNFQLNLPKNLGILVEKALHNLKEKDKEKT